MQAEKFDAVPALFAGQLMAFDYFPRTRVIFGPGSLTRLGELTRELSGKRVLLVTDRGLEEAGHARRGRESLVAAGIHVTLFEDVEPNPTTVDVERGLEVAKRANIDLIVGLGGGSSIDCAKGINFLLTNGGRMEDYRGNGKATRPMLPMIAVPTTAGTGSEAQSYAIIAQAQTHMKMACGDPKAACRVAILDAELTLTMPPKVTATTGIDALSHAVESYVTTKRNPVSQLFSREAWKLLAPGFACVMRDGHDLPARSGMMLGAHLAGAAIENSMLGATHALANPLSAHFKLPHGLAIALMLPHVVRFNAGHVGRLYGDLASDVGLCDRRDRMAGELLAGYISDLARDANLPDKLSACGVDRDLFPQMAEEAAVQWTGTFNPRPVESASLNELYEAAW